MNIYEEFRVSMKQLAESYKPVPEATYELRVHDAKLQVPKGRLRLIRKDEVAGLRAVADTGPRGG